MHTGKKITLLCLISGVSLITHAADFARCKGPLELRKAHNAGPNLHLERCDITGPSGTFQAIVASTQGKPSSQYGIHTKALQIFRGSGSDWTEVLDVGQQITNPAGYIGADYIDPDQASDHWIVVSNSHRKIPGVHLTIYFVAPDGSVDIAALPVEIAWNPKQQRFQELADDGSGFEAEKPHLPIEHIRH
jgi:hypothetical protein